MPTERLSTSAGRWMIHNLLAESLSSSAASYCRLRYEDFLANPDAALTQVFAPYKWVGDHSWNAATNEVVLEPTHSVSGNPMRFKNGPLKLKLDDEWHDAMSSRDRRMVTAMTLPLLMRYSYTARGYT